MLFGRRAQITAAGLTLGSPLRVRFDIYKPADGSQLDGWVEVYNLSAGNDRQLYERGAQVIVAAGYQQREGVILDGQAMRIEGHRQRRESAARVTRIKLGDYVHAPARAGGWTCRAYAGATPVRVIAADLVESDLGLTLGPLDAIPRAATVSDWSGSGRTADLLTTLLMAVECVWYENDGQIRVRSYDNPTQPDRPPVRVGPSGGLIGSPIETDEGAQAELWLNPLVERGTRLVFDQVPPYGEWAVAAVRHRGDTWEGDYLTWVDMRPT